MNEQVRIGTGEIESRQTENLIHEGAITPQEFTGKGSWAKVAAQARRKSYQPPTTIEGACWIPLSNGTFALVDEADAKRVNEKFWSAASNKTVRYAVFREWPSKKSVFLHHWILQVPDGKVIDHINSDGLDCRRSNMRICSPAENNRHTRKWRTPTTSQFKGVHYRPRYRLKWGAAINVNHKTLHLGGYASEIEAACAYDIAARKYFGEFASPNFPSTT